MEVIDRSVASGANGAAGGSGRVVNAAFSLGLLSPCEFDAITLKLYSVTRFNLPMSNEVLGPACTHVCVCQKG
jgi:hypothetical protein